MVMKLDIKKLLKNLAIPLLIGFIAGFLTRQGTENFALNVKQPPFTPPAVLFPIVWTILYALMGFSAYIIESSPQTPQRNRALVLYYIQLFFNFLWSFIFFNFNNYLAAFVWIFALLILIIATTIEFYKIKPIAGYLMIPYIVWVSLAAVLNFSIYLLN